MLANARGQAIIDGTVTGATWRGQPIVACSTDYTASPNALYWSNLLLLANLLDAPAIHIDVAHDGDIAPVLAALLRVQRFYPPGFAGPFAHSSGPDFTIIPVCGPIFFFDYAPLPNLMPDFAAAGTGANLANLLARATLNYRRGHLYDFAQNGVWLVPGEDLNLIQRPPIHTFREEFAVPNFWTQTLRYYWQSGSLFNGGQLYKPEYIKGLERLAALEPSYPSVSRYFMPLLISFDAGIRLLVLDHN